MNQANENIDATWLSAALQNVELPEYEAPEALSSYFESRAGLISLGEFERSVLHLIAKATSAMLNPTDWLAPFKPSIEWDGRRSALPSDLDSDELALLARIVPHVERLDLKARLADIAWTYGDRSNTAMLDLAINSYRAAPLTPDVWFSVGAEAWQRAFELANRRGADGRSQSDEMSRQLTARLMLASAEADQFFAVQLAELLRLNGRTPADERPQIASHLASLARSALSSSPRLSRHLEREAEGWLDRSAVASRLASIERRGRSYVAEADSRLAFDKDAGNLVEGSFLEKAIAVLLTLPRSYRQSNGIDALIQELRLRLRNSRETTLERMIKRTSEPIDLTAAASRARAHVSGHADRFDALAAFVLLLPPMDESVIRESAAKIVMNGIRRFSGSTTLSGDGRKVASSPGGNGKDEAAVWGEMARNVTSQAQTLAQGLLQPAQSVLTFEHHFDRDYFVELCIESPIVPEGHASLWGAGLAMGLEGDYGPAVALVVPQLEGAIRMLLKRSGTYTLVVDDDGVENEKGLKALLDMSETAAILGAGAVMELKALLVYQGGVNLRNEIAHGLVGDSTAWSLVSIYVWWFALRLVLWPVILMRRDSKGDLC